MNDAGHRRRLTGSNLRRRAIGENPTAWLGDSGAAPTGDTGKEINGVCAACHGEYGQGGKRGEYPRIAGKRAAYLMKQVQAYVKGERPHDEEGPVGILNRLQAKDIQDLLAYLTSIQHSAAQ